MTVTALKRTARLMALAAAFAACTVLFAPSAFATEATATVSGTVTLSNSAPIPAETIFVSLWELESDPVWGDYWAPSEDYWTDVKADGTWVLSGAIAPLAGHSYKVVFEDTRGWYQDTVYPSGTTDEWGEPAGGTLITPGADTNPLASVTMTLLPKSLTGTVKNSRSLQGLSDIAVDAYEFVTDEDGFKYWEPFFSTMTDASGNYELHGLAAGVIYRIGFTDYARGHSDTYYTAAKTVETATNVVAPTPPTVKSLGTTLMTRLVPVERIAPSSGNFWTQSVNVAKRQFAFDPSAPVSAENPADFEGVKDIVIVSGDARAQCDPLSAAGLCYAYQVTDEESYNLGWNAPLLMVSAVKATDPSVLSLVKSIASQNVDTTMTVHIVGGTAAVPDARFTEISKALTGAHYKAPIKDRVVAAGNRYDLSRGIAYRMKAVASKDASDNVELPDFVLVANGADSTKYFDSLALSPIAASMGAPILLVTGTTIPTQTSKTITALGTKKIILGGGTAAVSASVAAGLAKLAPVRRWWGDTRYHTARTIASNAIAAGWLFDDGSAAVAATVTDAQLGGAMAGNEAAPLLVVPSTTLHDIPKKWLIGAKDTLARVYVVGSTTSVNSTVFNAIKAAVAN